MFMMKIIFCTYKKFKTFKALNHGLILKKVNKAIQFNQTAWFKSYVDKNTKLTTEAKTDFENDSMNNADFEKIYGRCKKI